MDEISAIKSLISAGKPVTRAAVLAAVASTPYSGITGTISFDKNGDNTTPIGFSVYTCDTKGSWHYQASLGAPRTCYDSVPLIPTRKQTAMTQ